MLCARKGTVTAMSEKIVNSVKKALDILDILIFEDIDRRGISLKELSERSGIRPNTLHNILKTMKQCGYVEQNKKLQYLSGKRCTQLAVMSNLYMTQELYKAINEQMKILAEKTGVGASFYVLHNGERINYANVLSDKNIKIDYSMLKKNNIYDYPSGKILLAYCSENERERIIAKNGYPEDITTRRELNGFIREIKEKKYLSDITENDTVISFACAVFHGKEFLGSLGVYAPKKTVTPPVLKLMPQEMLKTAETIKYIAQ